MSEHSGTWIETLFIDILDHLQSECSSPSNYLPFCQPFWRISRRDEPGRLQSMRLQRVRHGWSNLTHMHCREYFPFLNFSVFVRLTSTPSTEFSSFLPVSFLEPTRCAIYVPEVSVYNPHHHTYWVIMLFPLNLATSPLYCIL